MQRGLPSDSEAGGLTVNPSVTFGDTSPYTGEARADVGIGPYAATADGLCVGRGALTPPHVKVVG